MSTTRFERHAAPLRHQVVTALREDILSGALPPGDRLLENALCETYAVSRTVIREALRQLEGENLITMLPGRGPIVTVLERRDIESLYEVRRALEGLAGELFARRASAQETSALIEHVDVLERDYLHGTLATRERSKSRFYRLLMTGAGNRALEDNLYGVHSRVGIFRRLAFADEARVEMTMHELRAIIAAAARDRDPIAARSACEQHIRRAGELAVRAYLEWAAKVGDGVGTLADHLAGGRATGVSD